MSTTTNGAAAIEPTPALLPAIISGELSKLAERSEQDGRHYDAQVARLALALIVPTPAPALQLTAPEGKPKRGRGRPPTRNGDDGVPASVADLAKGK